MDNYKLISTILMVIEQLNIQTEKTDLRYFHMPPPSALQVWGYVCMHL